MWAKELCRPEAFSPFALQLASPSVFSCPLSAVDWCPLSLPAPLIQRKAASLLRPSLKSPFPHSLWVTPLLSGCKFRLTAVELDQESWWPNQLSLVGAGGWWCYKCGLVSQAVGVSAYLVTAPKDVQHALCSHMNSFTHPNIHAKFQKFKHVRMCAQEVFFFTGGCLHSPLGPPGCQGVSLYV